METRDDYLKGNEWTKYSQRLASWNMAEMMVTMASKAQSWMSLLCLFFHRMVYRKRKALQIFIPPEYPQI